MRNHGTPIILITGGNRFKLAEADGEGNAYALETFGRHEDNAPELEVEDGERLTINGHRFAVNTVGVEDLELVLLGEVER